MANLHYANLPGVKNANQAGALAALARANLDNVETYLERVKKHQERGTIVAEVEVAGQPLNLVPSPGTSPKELTTWLDDETCHFLTIDAQDDIKPLDVDVEHRILTLHEHHEVPSAVLLRRLDQQERYVDREVRLTPLSRAQLQAASLPSYLVRLRPAMDTEAAEELLKRALRSSPGQAHIIPADKVTNGKVHQKFLMNRKAHGRPVSLSDHAHRSLLVRMSRLPDEDQYLMMRPDTNIVQQQIGAVGLLRDRPHPGHRGLIRTFETQHHADWPPVPSKHTVEEWMFLEDGYTGVEQQRKFVEIALNTPDFAILEGPPGSGKTAVITELILQAIERGERVLLTASTHVAVDNVVERLKDPNNGVSDQILLVRIGGERKRSKISDDAQAYMLDDMVNTELEALRTALNNQAELSPAQAMMRDALRGKSANEGRKLVERLFLEGAQVVCGTTMGMMEHPDLREARNKRKSTPVFDMMILDEASKTSFPEFLVPAVFAKRWIIVGDVRQLPPYADMEEIEVNVAGAFDKGVKRGPTWRHRIRVMHDALRNGGRTAALVVVDDEKDRAQVMDQALHTATYLHAGRAFKPEACKHLVVDLGEVDLSRVEDALNLQAALILVGTSQDVDRLARVLPVDLLDRQPFSPEGQARKQAIKRLRSQKHRSDESWEAAIAWRMKREYERKLFPDANFDEDEDVDEEEVEERESETWLDDVKALTMAPAIDRDALERQAYALTNVLKVGFPSVLEALQFGFGRGRRLKHRTALSHGIPFAPRGERHVALGHQHRMHPDISLFPRERFYRGDRLKDAQGMADKRPFLQGPRSRWLDVPDGTEDGQVKRNKREAEAILNELRRLNDDLSAAEPSLSKRRWSVAVLTFYRAQERLLLDTLRRAKEAKGHGSRGFRLGLLDIEVCTVDRFQGHEADVVLLSYVRTFAPGFLDSPNRLNVAITRARYMMIHVGRWGGLRKMAKRGAPHVAALAKHHEHIRSTDTAKKRRRR
ncbi:MAG: AAA domain-containing protein [Candidatus Thermoplasmatota archaeon]|nr:AAA domain-containing protein [Candidatus Thermoplasmatota archaeon]